MYELIHQQVLAKLLRIKSYLENDNNTSKYSYIFQINIWNKLNYSMFLIIKEDKQV